MKPYCLFLDDCREVKDIDWIDLPSHINWVVVRNFEQFETYIKLHGVPTTISLDHDLNSTELNGMDCVKWLVEFCFEHNHKFPEYYLHTLNDAGKKNMKSYIESYLKSQKL